MIIGITGNSGSGKSEISRLLAKKIDAEVIDADIVVRELSLPENEYYEEILNLFGNEILQNNLLNKKEIARVIYENKEKRESLNKLTYKYICNEIKRRIQNSKKEDIIIDAPLLFESGLDKICNFTIGILANEKEKIKRICIRDNIDEKMAIARLNIQEQDDFYIKRAQYIIENNEKIDEEKLEDICIKIGKN